MKDRRWITTIYDRDFEFPVQRGYALVTISKKVRLVKFCCHDGSPKKGSVIILMESEIKSFSLTVNGKLNWNGHLVYIGRQIS